MDEKSGMKKKPSAVSARPAARAPSGRGPAVPASSGPPTNVQSQAATPDPVLKTQETDNGSAESSPNVKAYIERQLKSVYDDVLNQPIPDRFLELLDVLDKTEGAKSAKEDKA
jgi:hypothetical protein